MYATKPSRRDLFEAALEIGGSEFAQAIRRMSPASALAAVRARLHLDSRPRLIERDSRTGLVESVTAI